MDFSAVLVDNGSETHDGETLQCEFPELALLRLDANRGFSGGCNAGIEFCLNRGADFIWLLNNDIRVAPNSLSALLHEARAIDRAGALGAVIVKRDGDTSETLARIGRGTIDFVNANVRLKEPFSFSSECAWLSGANLLLNAAAVRESGYLNDDYFLYYEDVELCRRLRHKGWKCILVPAAEIEHVESASTRGAFKPWRYYYEARNRLYYFASYPHAAVRLYCTARIILHHIRRGVFLPLRSGDKRVKLKTEWRALMDFLRGIRGQAEL